MTRKPMHLTLTIAILVGLLTYLASINFRLPFMTADEIRYLVAPIQEVIHVAVSGGRYSGLIMIPLSEALSFSTPNIVQLIPRFASMLFVALAIFLVIRKLGFSQLVGLALTAFVLITHELDWQHNGMVSFFGIYNVLFAAFIIAILISEIEISSRSTLTLATILLIVSYGSELFIGLSLCYLMLKAVTSRSANKLLLSPFLWALIIYGIAFLFIKATTSLRPSIAEGISTYLVGSVVTYGPAEMLAAALLYFINSLPYFHLLGLTPSTSIVASAILLLVLAAYIVLLLINTFGKEASSNKATANREDCVVVAMLALLAVVPNFLMALQPMKVDWILRNTSVHYAFSYYTWIGLAIICVYAARQAFSMLGDARSTRALSLILLAMLFAASAWSANQNQTFLSAYQASRTKWLQLNELLSKSDSKVVEIPASYLQHPYISLVEPAQLKAFAKKFYGVELHVCRTDNGIVLSEEVNKHFVKVEGFSSFETIGRWTDGPTASITLREEDPRIDFVELEVSGIFHTNKNTQVIIKKGDAEYRFQIDGIGKYRFDLPGQARGPFQIRFLIAEPMSPHQLGTSSDIRNLGVLVKTLKLGIRDIPATERLHVMKSCY